MEQAWTFYIRETCLSLLGIEPRFLGFRPPQRIREVMNPDYVTSTTHSPLVEFHHAEDLQLRCFTLPVISSALRLSLTLVNDQLDAQFFYFIIRLLQSPTCFEQRSALHQKVKLY